MRKPKAPLMQWRAVLLLSKSPLHINYLKLPTFYLPPSPHIPTFSPAYFPTNLPFSPFHPFLRKKTSLLTSLKINRLTNKLKKTSKKVLKKFGELKKRRTFAPANETKISLVSVINNTYIDIMLYSTKQRFKELSET